MPPVKISPVPSPVNIETKFFGPEEKVKIHGQKKEPRSSYSYAFNETASLTDSVAYDANVAALVQAIESKPQWMQKHIQVIEQIRNQLKVDPTQVGKTDLQLKIEAVKRYVDNPKNVESKNDKKTACDLVFALSQTEVNAWIDPEKVAQKYSPTIQEHFTRRVDLFLMQLVGCYGTRLHFEVGPTQHQAESSKSLYVEFNGTKQKVCKRGPKQATHNAAHSSTFPCLVAYDQEKWNAHKNGGTAKPKGIYFLQNSDLYKGTNSTCNLPRFVNDADIAVDGATHQSPFSNNALEVINQVSQGSITLYEAMKGFLESLEIEIRGKKRIAQDPGVKASLQVYYDEVKALSQEFESNPNEWIFTKIDLLIDHEETTNRMRAAMLKIRSEAIRQNMRSQTELMNKINLLSTQILKEIRQTKKSNAPAYYEEAFKLLLIDKTGTELNRQRLTKLFALVDPEKVGTRKAGIQKSKEVIAAAAMLRNVDRIKELASTLSADMRTLRTEETNHRGDAMRALRNGRAWTQVKLGRELRQRYPLQPSSQSTICRTERGYRIMSDQLAGQLSETFDIPKELLLPQVFFV